MFTQYLQQHQLLVKAFKNIKLLQSHKKTLSSVYQFSLTEIKTGFMMKDVIADFHHISSSKQGCQIFLGAKYQNGNNVPNYHELYQMSIKYNKRP
jgi:hypothetical protein